MPTPDAFVVQTLVAGLTYHQYKQLQDKIVAKPEVERWLYLEPDERNEYDPHAMKVLWWDEDTSQRSCIGFVPKKISEQVKIACAKHDWCNITVVEHDRAKSYRDRLTISIRCYSIDAPHGG